MQGNTPNRGDLQQLLKEIINNEEIIVTNEPARIREVGAPDYSITKNNIPIGYIYNATKY